MSTYKINRPCRLDDKLYLKVRYIAEKENRSFNNFLEKTLQELVKSYEQQHGEIKVNTDALYE